MKLIRSAYLRQPIKQQVDRGNIGDFRGCRQWGKDAKVSLANALGANQQSLDPLFQLARVPKLTWELIVALITGKPLENKTFGDKFVKATSIKNFKSLQGLTAQHKHDLLSQVYKGKLAWREMDDEAAHLKARHRLLESASSISNLAVTDLEERIGKGNFDTFIANWVKVFVNFKERARNAFPPGFDTHLLKLLSPGVPIRKSSGHKWLWTASNKATLKSYNITLGSREPSPEVQSSYSPLGATPIQSFTGLKSELFARMSFSISSSFFFYLVFWNTRDSIAYSRIRTDHCLRL